MRTNTFKLIHVCNTVFFGVKLLDIYTYNKFQLEFYLKVWKKSQDFSFETPNLACQVLKNIKNIEGFCIATDMKVPKWHNVVVLLDRYVYFNKK